MRRAKKKNSFPLRRMRPLILAFLLVSGSCGLIYEILWMKMLTLVIGNTVFSITTVLTAFMGGLALGSFLAGKLIDKIKDPLELKAFWKGASAPMRCSCRYSLPARSPFSALSIRTLTCHSMLLACCAFWCAALSCWCPPP